MPLEEQSKAATPRTSPSLLSLVPRSVVLSRLNMTTASNGKLDHKTLLLHSICRYLQANGFSKIVKKLKSQANLDEDESTDALTLDLEDLCSKHFETPTPDKMPALKSNTSKEDTSNTPVSKKKKKVKNSDDTGDVEKSGLKESHANRISEIETDTQSSKKKKKKHQTMDSVVNCDDEKLATAGASEKLEKSIKKKKQNSDTEDLSVKTSESKKRKRVSADDDSDQTNDDDEKLEAERDESATKNTNINDDLTNSNNGDKSSGWKSAKKPRNGSAEPTTLKAFQRVKVDEVVIKDERLKDNSYWAKDGAESGYGAKAQEILGQVRGKDFRHEKTKKKRGSYRGGQIDFNSHSIKFNDSDDE